MQTAHMPCHMAGGAGAGPSHVIPANAYDEERCALLGVARASMAIEDVHEGTAVVLMNTKPWHLISLQL